MDDHREIASIARLVVTAVGVGVLVGVPVGLASSWLLDDRSTIAAVTASITSAVTSLVVSRVCHARTEPTA